MSRSAPASTARTAARSGVPPPDAPAIARSSVTTTPSNPRSFRNRPIHTGERLPPPSPPTAAARPRPPAPTPAPPLDPNTRPQQAHPRRGEARGPLPVHGRVEQVPGHHHRHPGLHRRPERRQIVGPYGLHVVVPDGEGPAGGGGGRAVA